MNLTPFYELKERLEHTAIAGTSLIGEDFRLCRAIDGLTPLASASPVFAKIKAGAEELINAPAEERAARLLDLLGLVDAVAYTQGASGIQGELSPMPQGSGTYVPASYGQLQPLITALTGTGSGRMAVIENAWENHPEYFSDFRVLPQVVNALGSSYNELADFIEKILIAQGTNIIPALKQNFAPDGKKDMVRRVRIIARLTGANENEWYKAVLPDSTKNVREALITALRFSQDNTQLLLDLCQSERGNLKKTALRSLACMNSPEARAFWETEVKKRPKSAWELVGVNSRLAADIAARTLKAQIETLLQTDGKPEVSYEDLCSVITTAYGKYSDEMRDCWRWLGSQMESLDNTGYEKPRYAALTLSELLEKGLLVTVLWNPCEETFALAREMFAPDSCRFVGAAFAADLLTLPADEVYEKYAVYFDPARNQEQSPYRARLTMLLQYLRHDNDKFSLVVFPRDSLTGEEEEQYLPISTPDPRWSHLLTHPKLAKHYEIGSTSPVWHKKDKLYWDEMMRRLINPHSPEVCQTIGKYFYDLLWQKGYIKRYFNWLMECGWTKWEGVFVHCAQAGDRWVEWYWLKDMLQKIPVSGKVKAKELRDIDELVKSKKTQVRYGRWDKEEIAMFIAQWEAEPSADAGKEMNA